MMSTASFCGMLAVFGLVAQLSSGAVLTVETIITKEHEQLLGANECTYGPSFWCRNITNAAGCNAVKHCIQTTWVTQKYSEDNDDVCTICKNMVKEARDTLTSNATLEELQQVFYGSCQLLPLKVVKAECKKLADDFIPELVDTLASEMDPNVVCTVAGLCNNAYIDKLLLENQQSKTENEHHLCEKCAIAMDKGEYLVQRMSKHEVLSKIVLMCGELSSYSDACSQIVIEYENEIYEFVKNGFNKRDICMLSGMCSEAFHPHADGYEKSRNALMGVEINNAGERGRIEINKPNKISDDLTCEFCDTLVKHLRDIMIANTTEEQFLDVLQGLCKQTKSFSDECLSMVNENYGRIYQYLVSELNGKVLCTIVGICPKSLNSRHDLNYIMPSYPVIPIELIQTQQSKKIEDGSPANIEQDKQQTTLVVVDEQPPTIQDIKSIRKSPVIDIFYKEMHFVVNDVDMPTDKTTCFLCQSVLNYVQQTVTDPKSEEEIRTVLEKSCVVVPASFEQQCKQFVDQYGDAFIALVAQEVDPSVICPELKLCPQTDVTLTSNKQGESSNNCPMCVIFMSALESEISNNDTEEIIKRKLGKLCTKLPSKWKAECTDFVSSQLESLLDMLVAQVKPEEICVLLNVCKPKTLSESLSDDLETNMIATSGRVTVVFPDYNMGQLLANNYKMLKDPKVPTPVCLVCTVLMKYLNEEVKDKSNQMAIQRALDLACSVLPNVEESECQNFIDTNYNQIVKAIQIGTNPTIACMTLMVCDKAEEKQIIEPVKTNIQPATMDLDKSDECAVCEAFVAVFESRLNNISVEIDDIDIIELCYEVEVEYKEPCLEMIDAYSQSFKNLYNQVPMWMMCEKMSLCSKNKSFAVNQLSNPKCLEGAKYWCSSWDNAKECKASDFINLVKYGCRSSIVNNDDWIIRSLMELMRTNCYKPCVKTENVQKFHPKCTICEDIIHNIKRKIENSPIENDIKFRLEGLCDALPNKEKCVDFVETYTAKLINTIIDDINEKNACAEIGYC